MAFKEGKPLLTFKSFTDIPRNATAASNEWIFWEHKNFWLDPRTKKALKNWPKCLFWMVSLPLRSVGSTERFAGGVTMPTELTKASRQRY